MTERDYAMPRSTDERSRLNLQDAVFAPHSLDLFRAAGIGPGDRVLDAGCGAGDTTRLLSELVGESGTVIGVDQDEASLRAAEQMIMRSGRRNVSLRRDDLRSLRLEDPVDVVAGRLVLVHLGDPGRSAAALLRSLRPGGRLVLQEISVSHARAQPEIPAMTQWVRWGLAAAAEVGVDPDLGRRLPQILTGLKLRDVRAASVTAAGDADSLLPDYMAQTAASLAPLLGRAGVVDDADVAAFSPEAIRAQARAHSATLYSQELTCAWGTV